MRPVLVRELQAEARHPFTYWLRLLGAAAMLLVGAFGVLERGFSIAKGGPLFARLHLTLFCSIWVLVPLVTADCISRERREGTLGLLFLTPLTARGIVLAKGLAHGLRAMTLCLAVMPVLMIPFLMGGVSWQEALLSVATNFSAFCWALAAGLLASSWTRVWLRAIFLAMTLAACFSFLFGVVNLVCQSSAIFRYLPGPPGWSDVTPMTILAAAFLAATGINQAWKQLFAILPRSGHAALLWAAGGAGLVSLLGLAAAVQIAARNVRRCWQEEPASARQLWWERTFCRPVLGVTFFRKWMGWKLRHNPIGWLQQRTWSSRLIMWSWSAVIISINTFAVGQVQLYRGHFLYVHWLLAGLLAGSIALSSAGSFRRERETGLLELLLVSPLTAGQIVSGRVRGIWSQFLLASLLLVAVSLYFVESTDWIWLYGCTFFTLPVIGLYYSLQRTHFISAFLWTASIGALIPFFVAMLLNSFQPVSPNLLAGFFYAAILSGFVAIGVYCSARYLKKTGAVLCSAAISLLAVYLLFQYPLLVESVAIKPAAPIVLFVQERPSLFMAAALQVLLAAILGYKLYRNLVRRSF